jgi:uncharacterized protein (TIGR02246 family)
LSEEAIARSNVRLIEAFAGRDAAAAASCYTLDGKLMVPFAEPLVGRAAIEGFIRQGFERGIARLALETVALEVLDGTAWEEGLFTVWAADGTALDHGKYIVIWQKVDGQWLMARDIMSSNRPPREP